MRTDGWSFADAFRWSCERHARRVVWIQDHEELTGAQLFERAMTLGAALTQRLAPGDRVAILGANSADYLAAFAGAALARAALVPLNHRQSADELSYVLDDSGASLLLADAEYAQLAAALPVESAELGTLAHAGEVRGEAAEEDDLLALMYTAAVDGRPRGAMMLQRAFSYQMANMAEALELRPDDRFAIFTPLCHAAAVTYAFAALHAGSACVSLRRFDAAAAAAAIASSRVTILPGFAPMPADILGAAETAALDLASLRVIIARDDPSTIRRSFDRIPGLQWQVGNFGQTETQGMAVAGVRVDRAAFEAGTPTGGRRLPFTRISVVDAEGADVPDGVVGEIVVRGPNTAVGYWDRPAESEHATRGGWWHTGDLGRFDEHRLLQFAGRSEEKDLIKSGGENVYPEEVESVLRAHVAVADAAVIGVPDPRWTEAVRAMVVLAENASVTEEELIDHCRSSIAGYKKPRSIEFVDALPRTATGSVDRAALREVASGV